MSSDTDTHMRKLIRKRGGFKGRTPWIRRTGKTPWDRPKPFEIPTPRPYSMPLPLPYINTGKPLSELLKLVDNLSLQVEQARKQQQTQ